MSIHPPRDPLGRGTGRTMEMVMSLPEGGCVVIVHNATMITYVQNMIADMRGVAFMRTCRVRLVTRYSDVDRLRGNTLPIYIDHAFWDYTLRHEVREKVKELIVMTEMRRKSLAPP